MKTMICLLLCIFLAHQAFAARAPAISTGPGIFDTVFTRVTLLEKKVASLEQTLQSAMEKIKHMEALISKMDMRALLLRRHSILRGGVESVLDEE